MSSLCLKCSYSVTEPLCASCVVNEIRIWLYEQKIEKHTVKKINKELKCLLKKIESLDYVLLPSRSIWKVPIMKCIKCKKEMHLMCSYCVANQASQIIKDNSESEIYIESFQESFNTDLYDYELNKENRFISNVNY